MQTSAYIRVLVVDDSPELVEAIRLFVDPEPDMKVIKTLNCADALVVTMCDGADVAVVDLTMPGVAPLEAVRQAADSCPECRAIIYSGYDDQATIDAAMDAGAWGFVSKNAEIETIVRAVRQVASGEVVVLLR